MRSFLIFIALAGAPFPASAFQDTTTGFGFRAPRGVIVTPSSQARFDIGVAIDAAPGGPQPAGTGKHLCEAGFKAAAGNADFTQRQLNALAVTRERLNQVKTTIGLVFAVSSLRVLRLDGVAGVEIEARPKSGPSHEDARAYLTMHETPKGRVTMVCVTTARDWRKAQPLFRRLRSGLVMPK